MNVCSPPRMKMGNPASCGLLAGSQDVGSLLLTTDYLNADYLTTVIGYRSVL